MKIMNNINDNALLSDEKEYFVYMLRCSDLSIYTGYTSDLDKRIYKHNQGLAAKYTRSRRPVRLAASWKIKGRSQAMSLEAFLKKIQKSQKEKLIEKPELISEFSNFAYPNK